MRYCEICYVDLDKEEHKDYCPKKKPKKKYDIPEGWDELFKPKQ
jgi:hypothetical protein